MRLIRLLGVVLLAAGLSWAMTANAQRVVVQPASPKSDSGKDAKANQTQVQPVDPTPEQAEKIARLIEQLGAPTVRERDTAMGELAEFGACAINQVRQGQSHDDDEIAHRCTLLLEVLFSGKAELFLAARRLGMTDKDLEQKLSAADPTPLLELLEQNAGAGLSPIWARVLAGLSETNARYVAALACRRVEGAQGYGLALTKAARDAETRKSVARCDGLLMTLELLPPARGEDAALALATLASADSPMVLARMRARALGIAGALRGLYDASSCFGALGEENLKLLAQAGQDGDGRFLPAVVLALAPTATEAQLDSAKLPALTQLNVTEWIEYAYLCARSGHAARLQKMMESSARDALRITHAAHALAVMGEPALAAFDKAPVDARTAMLDAWWFAPPPALKLQPFLIQRLMKMSAAERLACARLLAGYRANSTARELARCALASADTAPALLEALAPMAELLPQAAPQEFKELMARLSTAPEDLKGPLIDVLSFSGDAEADKALRARWKAALPLNELWRAVRHCARNVSSPAGALSAALVFWGTRLTPSREVFLRQYLSHRDWVLLKELMARDDAWGFAVLDALARDPQAAHSGYALLALALADKDSALAPEAARLFAERVDPRMGFLEQYLAISHTPAGEEFRGRGRKLSLDSGEAFALVAALNVGRGRGLQREALLEQLAQTPGDYFNWHPLLELTAAGELPPAYARALASNVLLNRDPNHPAVSRDEAIALWWSAPDVRALLYGAQEKPVPRTVRQMLATAALMEKSEAAELIARTEPARDGSDFEMRECARAATGLLPANVASAIMRGAGQGTMGVFWLLREARGGHVPSARMLLDSFLPIGYWQGGSGFACYLAGSRYYGEGYDWGDALAMMRAPISTEQSTAMAAPLLRALLQSDVAGDGARWWQSRRGLLEFDAQSGRLKLAALE